MIYLTKTKEATSRNDYLKRVHLHYCDCCCGKIGIGECKRTFRRFIFVRRIRGSAVLDRAWAAEVVACGGQGVAARRCLLGKIVSKVVACPARQLPRPLPRARGVVSKAPAPLGVARPIEAELPRAAGCSPDVWEACCPARARQLPVGPLPAAAHEGSLPTRRCTPDEGLAISSNSARCLLHQVRKTLTGVSFLAPPYSTEPFVAVSHAGKPPPDSRWCGGSFFVRIVAGPRRAAVVEVRVGGFDLARVRLVAGRRVVTGCNWWWLRRRREERRCGDSPSHPLLSSQHNRILLSPRASLTPRAKLSFQLLSRASSVSPRRPTMDPISDTHHGGGGAAVIEDSAADDYVGVERPSEGVDDDGGNPNSGVEGNEGDEVLLGRNVVTLSCQNVDGEICDVWLIGTLHVSQDSCREVQAIISHLEPEIRTMNEMIDMWRKNQNLFGIIFIWFLAKVADKLEVLPGSEFRVAFGEAKKCCSKMFLGDRPVQITLWRTWAKMPLWHKIKLVHYFLFAPFFLPNAEDLNRMEPSQGRVRCGDVVAVIRESSEDPAELFSAMTVNKRRGKGGGENLVAAGDEGKEGRTRRWLAMRADGDGGYMEGRRRVKRRWRRMGWLN
ncbi:hypothetical protein Droror1_Dr00003074 [Drosera rotundifolia]